MKISRGHWVTLRIRLADANGREIDVDEEDEEHVRYQHGTEEILPGIERALEGASEGDSLELTLDQDDAFGPYEPEGLFSVPLDAFEDRTELERGAWISIHVAREEGDADEEEGELEARVVEIGDEEVVLDANHPLAGKTVAARIEVLAVEE